MAYVNTEYLGIHIQRHFYSHFRGLQSQPFLSLNLTSSFHPLKLKSVWKSMHAFALHFRRRLCKKWKRKWKGGRVLLRPMLWIKCWISVCMDLVIFLKASFVTQHPPSQLQQLTQTLWCLRDNLFAPTGRNTWVNITHRAWGALSFSHSLCFCYCYQTARSGRKD